MESQERFGGCGASVPPSLRLRGRRRGVPPYREVECVRVSSQGKGLAAPSLAPSPLGRPAPKRRARRQGSGTAKRCALAGGERLCTQRHPRPQRELATGAARSRSARDGTCRQIAQTSWTIRRHVPVTNTASRSESVAGPPAPPALPISRPAHRTSAAPLLGKRKVGAGAAILTFKRGRIINRLETLKARIALDGFAHAVIHPQAATQAGKPRHHQPKARNQLGGVKA